MTEKNEPCARFQIDVTEKIPKTQCKNCLFGKLEHSATTVIKKANIQNAWVKQSNDQVPEKDRELKKLTSLPATEIKQSNAWIKQTSQQVPPEQQLKTTPSSFLNNSLHNERKNFYENAVKKQQLAKEIRNNNRDISKHILGQNVTSLLPVFEQKVAILLSYKDKKDNDELDKEELKDNFIDVIQKQIHNYQTAYQISQLEKEKKHENLKNAVQNNFNQNMKRAQSNPSIIQIQNNLKNNPMSTQVNNNYTEIMIQKPDLVKKNNKRTMKKFVDSDQDE